MKKIVIVSSSPRVDGNSETLAKNFMKGAVESGNQVEYISINDIDLKFCKGCFYCQNHDGCVLKDGMNALYSKFEQADVLVFATPVYYYSVSGQLKTFLDRLNPLYPRDNKFKEVYLLCASHDSNPNAMDGCVSDVNGWISCFDGVTFKGVLRAVGIEKYGEVLKTDFPLKAYEMGKGII